MKLLFVLSNKQEYVMYQYKILVLLISFSCSFLCSASYAMKEITLDCMNKGEVIIFHTNYKISTLKNNNEFYVSPGSQTKMINGVKYSLYPFLNGDMYINQIDNSQFHLIMFHDGERIQCQSVKSKNISITNLPIVK